MREWDLSHQQCIGWAKALTAEGLVEAVVLQTTSPATPGLDLALHGGFFMASMLRLYSWDGNGIRK